MKLPKDKYTKYLKSRWLTLEHECLHGQLSLCYLVRKVWFLFRLLWLQPQPTICWVNKASLKMLEDKHTLCDKEIKMEVTSFSKRLINLQPLALVLRTTALYSPLYWLIECLPISNELDCSREYLFIFISLFLSFLVRCACLLSAYLSTTGKFSLAEAGCVKHVWNYRKNFSFWKRQQQNMAREAKVEDNWNKSTMRLHWPCEL